MSHGRQGRDRDSYVEVCRAMRAAQFRAVTTPKAKRGRPLSGSEMRVLAAVYCLLAGYSKLSDRVYAIAVAKAAGLSTAREAGRRLMELSRLGIIEYEPSRSGKGPGLIRLPAAPRSGDDLDLLEGRWSGAPGGSGSVLPSEEFHEKTTQPSTKGLEPLGLGTRTEDRAGTPGVFDDRRSQPEDLQSHNEKWDLPERDPLPRVDQRPSWVLAAGDEPDPPLRVVDRFDSREEAVVAQEERLERGEVVMLLAAEEALYHDPDCFDDEGLDPS